MLNPETATVTKDALDFWRQQFSARLVPVGIPLTRPRPPSSSYLRESVTVEMSTATAVLFAAAAVAKESSLAMLVLAALQTVLFRHTGQERIVVGAFVPEAESLLPVQSHWNSDTGVSLPLLAGQLAAWLRGASKYSSYPLREMQNWAGAEDAVFGVRLFNVSFFWDEGRSTDWPMADPEFGQFVSQCDIVLKASPSDKGLTFRADYDADVLEAGTVARMVNHILMVLEGAAHNPIATIQFKLNGEKKIMLNYAKLRILDPEENA